MCNYSLNLSSEECRKRLFFNILKVILKIPSLSGTVCVDRDPVKCYACAVNQKIVTAWFSGNALTSRETLIGISCNLVEY